MSRLNQNIKKTSPVALPGDIYDIKSARFCARDLGMACARKRYWAILTNKKTVGWSSTASAASLLDLLAAFCCQPTMKVSSQFKNLAQATKQDLRSAPCRHKTSSS